MADADPIRPTTGPLRTVELIRDRTVEAVLGQSGLNHPGLAAEIRQRFGGTDVERGALVREPVIEGAAPFVSSGRTFADCAGNPLNPAVVRAISDPRAEPYRFDPLAQPYKHQLAAWQLLTADERQSVLVSSGTGSGKTECFLMPLLSDLATEADQFGKLSGVRAIALYPLNALIASQQERLRAWTAPFGDRVRFGLYNGLTPERPLRTEKPSPEQVRDRVTLRSDPPPILVTNVTMLEYMIVRRVDRPLIENSRGKLRWIILDEAHSYVGSAAAEIALLIRRVLLTFGVKAEDVRFVATSATIGDGKDVTDELRRFLRDLSGAQERRIHVITGEREKVLLPEPVSSATLSPVELKSRNRVAANPAVQAFVRAAESRPVRLDEAQAMLSSVGEPVERVIEAIADGSDQQRGPLLPLRIHGFLRAVPGLWSCLNPACDKAPADWPFGAVLSERIDQCSCGSPVFEVKTCRDCGEPYLFCEEHEGFLRAVTTPPTIDEFASLAERELGDAEEEEQPVDDHDYDVRQLALATRSLDGRRIAHIEPKTGRRNDEASEVALPLGWHDPETCGACGAKDGDAGPVLRPLRYGAPFLIGNAAPVLLEGVPRRQEKVESAFRPPAEGRQLLSFTDSRQGTARFAANLQTNAERGYVRGFLYHTAQGSMVSAGIDDPVVLELRAKITAMEAAAPDALAELIAKDKAALATLLTPNIHGSQWGVVRDRLAATAEVSHWMAHVWGPRDERYRADPRAFAEFLLLRELARRPRRANTAETMGLVRLRFDVVDRASRMPSAIDEAGFTTDAWQGLLYNILDMVVRAQFAIRASWDDAHWLHSRTPLAELLRPGDAVQASREKAWPKLSASKRQASNLVLILEKALRLDRQDQQDRARINEVLEAAWEALQPLFHSNIQPGYALDFTKGRIAPVGDAWRCPVTRRVLPALALGYTPYGHREHLRTADSAPQPISFPRLPLTFPKGNEVEVIRDWLDNDQHLATLRDQGVWADLHGRVALLSPYLRAAEHSAQQPPARLRRFEAEFKRGEINILNCSTTMEMGVDIGSVSAVLMTNVPPALANYRQRVGRAGRRRQGFASSLTYARNTPLDREAFRDPQLYLARETRAPRVNLDSRRIVQRHVNALLLARWFAGEGGEAMKTRVGDFFGLPGEIGAEKVNDAAISVCLAWLGAPSTAELMRNEVATLVQGTVLSGSAQLFTTAASVLHAAYRSVTNEWEAIQAQGVDAPKEGRDSLAFQLKRLVNDNLLKELGYRGVLPAHGFPTGVVPFVNNDKPAADERNDGDNDDSSRRRRSFPTRTLDIAIRDYAPGAEVVVDGLVYRSAGVTLNWLRPADDAQAREIQSLKTFWNCPSCGAADCAHAAPTHCPACHSEVPLQAQLRFLEPAGFTADMREQPHADTNEVSYVEPDAEQIVARGALWAPMSDPSLGRVRASNEGLVFYSSRGPQPKLGYHICLDCGRAAPAGQVGADHPLKDHVPLRFTKTGADGRCPGNDKPFKITKPPVALGYETLTDVVELQPVGLETAGAAWAAVSALREALARQLGIETGELGIAVRPAATPLGQRTHSLFLYDRASGGAGFAPQATTLFDTLLKEAARILDCPEPGCVRGCSACILAADLYRQAERLDRQAALAWVRMAYSALADLPEADRAAPDAVLARSVSDELAEVVDRGARSITLWLGNQSDVAALAEGRLPALAQRLTDQGAAISVVVESDWLNSLDPTARLAIRDAALRRSFTLQRGTAPRCPNGAVAVAAAGGERPALWASRDPAANVAGDSWGQGTAAPVVRFAAERLPLAPSVDLATLLPPSGTRYIEIRQELDGTIAGFGQRLTDVLLPAIRIAGEVGMLEQVTYNDRYLQSPLVVRLLGEALSALKTALGGSDLIPARIITNRLKPNVRQPFAPDHDWQWEEDRKAVLLALLTDAGFSPELIEFGADHGRTLTLRFVGGKVIRVILDQGFGPWRTPGFARWDHFGEAVERQASKIAAYSALITARGPSYMLVTR